MYSFSYDDTFLDDTSVTAAREFSAEADLAEIAQQFSAFLCSAGFTYVTEVNIVTDNGGHFRSN